ncbi:hypothetical protein BDN70DRAFT_802554 [Pholiota conissans]|uniref:HMG box domain-containing protein n=1 Tax=Pholiota conissans TaxID=109636 RepID=A0A9P5Z809_9AGAR|nr:hypothetical protein BDN70DRAFT_802554 [Pholiota conissans]
MSSAFDYTDNDHLIFGPIDLDDGAANYQWDSYAEIEPDVKPVFPFHYDYGPHNPYDYNPQEDPAALADLATWIHDPDPSPSSPIPIPSPSEASSSSFYHDPAFSPAAFHDPSAFSPAAFAALHPLPRSMSPPAIDASHPPQRLRVHSTMSPHPPAWAAHLWDAPSAPQRTQHLLTRPAIRHSPLTSDAATLRQRRASHSAAMGVAQLFPSTSAPAETIAPGLGLTMTRASGRRADSMTFGDERDATIRKKKRTPEEESPSPVAPKAADTALKSVLRPPKLAPSAWQLYFTDWIQKQQASGTRKLNVAQAAKEAGQEYACLSPSQKEPYKRRSQAMKEAREKEHEAYMRTLTPEDIKRENLFRAAQRKAGKSRRSNIKDPNAPKKPLSAYFMFLQRIRAHPRLVQEIFGDETETTKQSVLAAARWRAMTDAERQPFLAQAEQEKMEYEAARRLYEEGTTGFGSSINFSILPGSPHFPLVKMESESESEGFMTDEGERHPAHAASASS